jgi:hypothetical protein
LVWSAYLGLLHRLGSDDVILTLCHRTFSTSIIGQGSCVSSSYLLGAFARRGVGRVRGALLALVDGHALHGLGREAVAGWVTPGVALPTHSLDPVSQSYGCLPPVSFATHRLAEDVHLVGVVVAAGAIPWPVVTLDLPLAAINRLSRKDHSCT